MEPSMILPSVNSAAWVTPGSVMEMASVFFANSSKTGMDVAFAECADVADVDAVCGLGVGHDGAVAAEFFDDGGELDIGAFAGGGADATAELGDGLDAVELIAGALAFVDGVDDLIDESVDADEDADVERGRPSLELCEVFSLCSMDLDGGVSKKILIGKGRVLRGNPFWFRCRSSVSYGAVRRMPLLKK